MESDLWVVLAVILAGAGGVVAAMQKSWATLLVAAAVLCLALPVVIR